MNKLPYSVIFISALLVALTIAPNEVKSANADIALDAKAQLTHRLDSLNLLLYTFLLTLTVLTIWLFKHRRLSFLHETGLAVIYGKYLSIIVAYPKLHFHPIFRTINQTDVLDVDMDSITEEPSINSNSLKAD